MSYKDIAVQRRSGSINVGHLNGQRIKARESGSEAQGMELSGRREVSPFVQARIPELNVAPANQNVWHFSSEGLVIPSILLAYIFGPKLGLRKLSCSEHTQVTDVIEKANGVSLHLSSNEKCEKWDGDFCIIATGRWTPSLVAALGVNLAMVDAHRKDKIACGFLAVTDPQLVQLRANLISPLLNVRPEGYGRLLLQAPGLYDRADPTQPATADGEVAHEILHRV